jgi:ferredoxin-type protein NapH
MVIMTPETELKRYQRRQRLKIVLLTILPLLIGIAWFYPLLGFIIFLWMGLAVGIAFIRGRAWCDICPRGAFFDVVMSRISLGKPVPSILHKTFFCITILILMMTAMGILLASVWGNAHKMGATLTMILVVTTIIGVLHVLCLPRRILVFSI